MRVPRGRRVLTPAVATAVGADLAGIGLTATAAWLIASAAGQPLFGLLGTAIAGVRACALARGLLRYLERLSGHELALGREAGLRAAVFTSLAGDRNPISWATADVLRRVTSDVSAVRDRALNYQIPVVTAALTSVLVIAGLALLHPPSAAVAAAGIAVAGVVIPLAASRRVAGAAAALAPLQAGLATAIGDVLAGTGELLVYGAADRYTQRVERQAAQIAAAQRARGMALAAAAATGLVAQIVTTMLVIGVAVSGPSPLPRVEIVVVALATLAAFEPLRQLPAAFVERHTSAAALDRVAALLGPAPQRSASAPVRRSAPPDINLRDVVARGGGERVPALRGVSLDIRAGTRVAITGPSGAGKSTLLALLTGAVRPDAGDVLVAGRPPAPPATGRPLVAGVSEDAHLFHASISENLRIGRPGASADEQREALRTAGLLEEVDALPDGLETVVGHHGRHLSGGQGKRLLLARALLGNPEILILDEPTEGLHEPLAAAVIAATLDAMRGSTVLFVTHDLSLAADFDEVLVLVDGELAARGAPALDGRVSSEPVDAAGFEPATSRV